MAVVLAYTSPALGHLLPLVPILIELRERGHDVHLRTLAGQVERMNDLGFRTDAIDPGIEAVVHDDYAAKGAKAGLAAAARVFADRGALDAPDMREAMDQVQPDAVIVDVNSWGAGFTLEAADTPWATFSPYIPALTSPGTPPFGPGLRPMVGPLGRWRDALARRLVLGAIEQSMLPRLNGLRTDLGLETVATVEEFLRKSTIMFVTTAKPFEYDVTDWGPDVVMIGVTAWEPSIEHSHSLPDDGPVVLVTTSSEFQDDGVLARTALAALQHEPVRVVVTMPAGVPDDLVVPPNATVVEFASHAALLEHAVAAVTHGGMGATQKALAHGVPVCVVPFGRDQLEVARRAEVAGAGVRLSPRRLSEPNLRAAVRTAMTMSDGAKRVAQGYVDAGGAETAADALEARLLAKA